LLDRVRDFSRENENVVDSLPSETDYFILYSNWEVTMAAKKKAKKKSAAKKKKI